MSSSFGSEKLEAITIHNSVENIEDGAFYFCENLENLTLGHGLFEFGVWLKANTKLTSITIPENIKRIKCLAFTEVDARQLVTVIFNDTSSNWYETTDKKYTHTEENKKIGAMSYKNPDKNATLLKEKGLSYYLYNDNSTYYF
ncbi:MAG: leucine-rich repeat protein [Treponema sp.]|nr:leucine-rich repeat protein [Treponema sp.]